MAKGLQAAPVSSRKQNFLFVGAQTSMTLYASSMVVSWFLQGTSGSGLLAFLPLVVIMVIFYVLLIMPAQRRQKKTQAMLEALQMGDKIVTSGGLYGTIVGLEPEAVQLRIADQVKVKVARSAISGVQTETKEG
jgi:preprotein translocase subunit YajC